MNTSLPPIKKARRDSSSTSFGGDSSSTSFGGDSSSTSFGGGSSSTSFGGDSSSTSFGGGSSSTSFGGDSSSTSFDGDSSSSSSGGGSSSSSSSGGSSSSSSNAISPIFVISKNLFTRRSFDELIGNREIKVDATQESNLPDLEGTFTHTSEQTINITHLMGDFTPDKGPLKNCLLPLYHAIISNGRIIIGNRDRNKITTLILIIIGILVEWLRANYPEDSEISLKRRAFQILNGHIEFTPTTNDINTGNFSQTQFAWVAPANSPFNGIGHSIEVDALTRDMCEKLLGIPSNIGISNYYDFLAVELGRIPTTIETFIFVYKLYTEGGFFHTIQKNALIAHFDTETCILRSHCGHCIFSTSDSASDSAPESLISQICRLNESNAFYVEYIGRLLSTEESFAASIPAFFKWPIEKTSGKFSISHDCIVSMIPFYQALIESLPGEILGLLKNQMQKNENVEGYQKSIESIASQGVKMTICGHQPTFSTPFVSTSCGVVAIQSDPTQHKFIVPGNTNINNAWSVTTDISTSEITIRGMLGNNDMIYEYSSTDPNFHLLGAQITAEVPDFDDSISKLPPLGSPVRLGDTLTICAINVKKNGDDKKYVVAYAVSGFFIGYRFIEQDTIF